QPGPPAQLQSRRDEHRAGDGRGDAGRAAAPGAVRLLAEVFRRQHGRLGGEGMTPALAIDLGGTNLRAALFQTREIAPDAVPPHLLQQAAPQNLDAFRQTVETLLDQTGAGALGIAVPGLVEGTVCRWAPNLRWLDDVDFA